MTKYYSRRPGLRHIWPGVGSLEYSKYKGTTQAKEKKKALAACLILFRAGMLDALRSRKTSDANDDKKNNFLPRYSEIPRRRLKRACLLYMFLHDVEYAQFEMTAGPRRENIPLLQLRANTPLAAIFLTLGTFTRHKVLAPSASAVAPLRSSGGWSFNGISVFENGSLQAS